MRAYWAGFVLAHRCFTKSKNVWRQGEVSLSTDTLVIQWEDFLLKGMKKRELMGLENLSECRRYITCFYFVGA